MKKRILSLLLAVVLLSLAGCKQSGGTSNPPAGQNQTGEQAQVPELPEFERYEDGVPVITVYNTASQEYENVDVETYVMGVLAGEMRNDWPMEALRAQAILARTFTLKFISEKDSMYPYADISTDVTEAQAYDASAVNERVRRAVEETRGEIMSYQGELPYAWFHAHAAGKTDLASVGLHFDSDPGYIRPVESRESDLAPTSVKNWTAVFDASEVLAAARKAGASLEKLESIELGEKGESGRAIDLLINGERVNAADLRVNLDSTRLKSTLLSEVSLKDGKVSFTGQGYGHGVGMSQWGAYQLASEGETGEHIVQYYFSDVSIVKAW